MALLEVQREVCRSETSAAARRPARRVTEAKLLNDVVAELKGIDRRTGIERTLAIGELILNQFFGGDSAVWRDRRRNKNNSIRRLAEREDCPFCRSALNEAVGVYVAVVGLPCVRTFGHISASHVASVLRLPGPERQPVLERAENERWSVRELRHKVILLRRAEGERRGRPPGLLEKRYLSLLRRQVNRLTNALDNIEKTDNVAPELCDELRSLAGQLGLQRSRMIRLAEAGSDSRAIIPQRNS